MPYKLCWRMSHSSSGNFSPKRIALLVSFQGPAVFLFPQRPGEQRESIIVSIDRAMQCVIDRKYSCNNWTCTGGHYSASPYLFTWLFQYHVEIPSSPSKCNLQKLNQEQAVLVVP